MKKMLMTIAALIIVCLATATGVFAEEALIYSEDFSDDVQRWWGSGDGLNSVSNSDGDSVYTDGVYVTHINGAIRLNTCNQANAVSSISKAYYSNGSIGQNTSFLPTAILMDDYKIVTEVNLCKAIAKDVTEGVYTFTQVVLSDYKMQYAICYNGIWVVNSDGNWVKGVDIVHDSLLTDFSDEKKNTLAGINYDLTVEVSGANAKITAISGENQYTYSWTMPTASGYNVITDIQMSAKSNEVSGIGYNMVDVSDIEILNVSEGILYDDATDTAFENAQYGSNLTNYTVKGISYNKTGNIGYSLTDATVKSGENNMITYEMPANSVLKNFHVLAHGQAIQNQGIARGEFKFYGVKDGVKTELSATRSIKYINNWPLKFELADDVLDYEYDALAIELLSTGEYPARALSVAIEYEELPEFYTVKPSKEEVLIDDDFKIQRWNYVTPSGAATNHTGYSANGAKFDSLNINVELSLKMKNNPISKYILTGYIKENYKDYNKYYFTKVVEDTPENDQYGVKKTIQNGKYEMTYAVAYDGIWVMDTTGWVKAIEITNEEDFYKKETGSEKNENLYYEIWVDVTGSSAKLTAKYQTVEGGDYTTSTYSFTMPETTSFNAVTITSKVSDKTKGRNRVYVQASKLTNICDHLTLVDDAQKKYDFVKYGSNIEINTVSTDGSLNYSQLKQIDLIDPEILKEPENLITYNVPAGGYLKDFCVTRRINNTKQGVLYFALVKADGGTYYLNVSQDLIEKVVYLNSGHVYYYMPTDVLKAKLENGEYVKLVCRLNVEGNVTERSSALLRTSISYDVPVAYELGEVAFDIFDGNAALFGSISKNVASAPNFKLIIASYDDEGHLIETKATQEYKLSKGKDQLLTSQTVKAGASHKVFLWATDADGNLTQNPILPAIEEKGE